MNNRLNEYLTEVETRLRPLPPVDREQEIAEIAQHLNALISAHQNDGRTEEAATEAAITQFGTAREVGKQLYQTGRHQRFAPLLEVGLFGVAFYAVLSMAWVLCVGVANRFNPLFQTGFQTGAGQGLFDIRHVPVSWMFGFAASAVIVSRYGWRGAKQKAFGAASPVSAGIRWMFLNFVLGIALPYGISRAFVVPHSVSMLNMSGSAMPFYGVFGLGTMWLSAYLAGRSCKGSASVANAVGLAGLVEAVWWIITWAYQFVPTPWHYAQPASFASLLRFFCFLVCAWAVNFFIVRFFVQVGEKARPLPRHVKQTA